ncbi:MAG: alginate export family protein [Acidobacteria bacterium]|nr:alginate export family protein [Acidobacteriota bacterium]
MAITQLHNSDCKLEAAHFSWVRESIVTGILWCVVVGAVWADEPPKGPLAIPMKRITITFALILALWFQVFAQENRENESEKPEPPGYHILRAEEDYSYLRNKEKQPYKNDLFDPLKFMPVNSQGTIFLTLGGEIRPRFEFFRNDDWGSAPKKNDGYYSQRLSMHAALSLAEHVRVFGEIYHGLLSKGEKVIAQDDSIDLHQGFLEINLHSKENQKLRVRLGRQELNYGSARLVGLREGPNIRRSFDAARLLYANDKANFEGFVGSEVKVPFGAFNNSYNDDMLFWGGYSRFQLDVLPQGSNELYYFGFSIDSARFNDGIDEETRHSIGLRRSGKLGRSFRYNTELMYQFGSFGDKKISAFALEGDWHYRLHDAKWKPEFGMKLDYISGDRKHGDDKLNTFNPLFDNPAYFGLLGKIAPMNLVDIHPSVKLEPDEKVEIIVDWDFFWRASKEDGLYAPPRFLIREGHEAESRWIGHQPGFELVYRINRHFSWKFEASYFVTGEFMEETGESKNLFYFASTSSFKF